MDIDTTILEASTASSISHPIPSAAAGTTLRTASNIWTVADLDAALVDCIGESWADELTTKVFGVLAPMLRSRGFICAEPEKATCASQYDKDYAGIHAGRPLVMVDPIGAAEGRRLQANVGVGLIARMGASFTQSVTGIWQRSVRITTTMSASISYATPEGLPLPTSPEALSSVQLFSAGKDLHVSDIAQVTDWWRTANGMGALNALDALCGSGPLLALEDMVERGLDKMAP